ncbi:MAG TPA: 30S ribosomal protein S8 [Candidatus Saccharimonadales bacterium]|jgi:small subunit ribosomal protein S8|nr:30S ribosomal protein S8 [Candidatus Saccharimonadales bacterium]
MVSTDPIADMLTRIRNAVAVRKHEISLPHSKVKQSVAELLKTNGFVKDVAVAESGINKTLKIVINDASENARITEIVRMSKPGRRAYKGAGEIPVVKRGRGLVIVSTSKGMMTGDQARKLGVGGELICKVY